MCMCWNDLLTKRDLALLMEHFQNVVEGKVDKEFTAEEAAAYLKVSLTTFRQWCDPRKQAKPIRPCNEGKPPKYPRSECIRFLLKNRL
jgi:predicted  nucleic acid-binding Zn ribbon protein